MYTSMKGDLRLIAGRLRHWHKFRVTAIFTTTTTPWFGGQPPWGHLPLSFYGSRLQQARPDPRHVTVDIPSLNTVR